MLFSTGYWVAFWILGIIVALCVITLVLLGIRKLVNALRHRYSYDEWPVWCGGAAIIVGILGGLIFGLITNYGMTSADISHDLQAQGYQVVSVHQDETGSYYSATVHFKDGTQRIVQVSQSDSSGLWQPSVSCPINADGQVSTAHCVTLPR